MRLFCYSQILRMALCLGAAQSFVVPTHQHHPQLSSSSSASLSRLHEMKRPLLDQIASTVFNLETERVRQSSEVDDKGRMGEPMSWSESSSTANRFSEIMANRAYGFKQFVADLVAGDYDKQAVEEQISNLIENNDVAMFSFSTCPFCRRAKDALEERGIAYGAVELDELEGNLGNEIRAQLGRQTKRTSVPSIFVKGTFIGGCNDGPGLMPLLESGEFETILQSS